MKYLKISKEELMKRLGADESYSVNVHVTPVGTTLVRIKDYGPTLPIIKDTGKTLPKIKIASKMDKDFQEWFDDIQNMVAGKQSLNSFKPIPCNKEDLEKYFEEKYYE